MCVCTIAMYVLLPTHLKCLSATHLFFDLLDQILISLFLDLEIRLETTIFISFKTEIRLEFIDLQYKQPL